MPGAKIVAIFPRPTDSEAFEKQYLDEHIPLAAAKLQGQTKIVMTKGVDTPQGPAPFHRLAEVHFPSMEALQACMAAPATAEVVAHAFTISTGGPPMLFVAEEETVTF